MNWMSRGLELSALFVLEVKDKEWPLWFVILLFVGLGIAGLLLCRAWPRMAVLFVALVILGGIGQVIELNDPYVGPAIKHEAGLSYVILSYSSISAGVVLPLIGAWLGRKARKDMA